MILRHRPKKRNSASCHATFTIISLMTWSWYWCTN